MENFTMLSEKPPENYYSRRLGLISVLSYVALMLSIFLAFGYIRVKRGDKKKSRGLDKIEEMMESFGLLDFKKEELMTITKSFNAKLKTEENDLRNTQSVRDAS